MRYGITGSKGFLGRSLYSQLNNSKKPDLLYEFDPRYTKIPDTLDVIFHLGYSSVIDYARNNEISLDLGPFVKAIEYASNKNAVLMGKPNKNFFDLVVKDLNSHHENILMIGDDIKSDIEGGSHAGLKTIQVKTGKYQSSDDQNSLQRDSRVENINEVLNLL